MIKGHYGSCPTDRESDHEVILSTLAASACIFRPRSDWFYGVDEAGASIQKLFLIMATQLNTFRALHAHVHSSNVGFCISLPPCEVEAFSEGEK